MAKLIFLSINIMLSMTWAEPLLKIDLKKAVALTVENNLDIQNARANRVSQKYALRASQYEFELQNTLTAAGTVVDSNITNKLSTSTVITPTTSFKTHYGTELELTPIYNLDNSEDTHFRPTLVVRQPLIRNFGPKVVLADLHTAEEQNEIDKLNYQKTISGAVSDTLINYTKVISNKRKINAIKRSLLMNRLNLEQTKIHFQFGRASKSDVNDQRLQIANTLSDVAATEADYQDSINELKKSMNIKNKHIELADDLHVLREILPIPSEQEARKIMLKKNNAYNRLKHELIQNEQSYIQAKNNLQIDLNLVGTKQLYGTDDESSLKIELDVPINNVTKKKSLVDAKTNVIESRQQIDAQVTFINNYTHSAIQALHLLDKSIIAQRQQLKLRNMRLKVDQARQEKGYISSFEVNQKIQDRDEEIDKLQALEIDYATKIIDFYKQMGIFLGKWQIVFPKNY